MPIVVSAAGETYLVAGRDFYDDPTPTPPPPYLQYPHRGGGFYDDSSVPRYPHAPPNMMLQVASLQFVPEYFSRTPPPPPPPTDHHQYHPHRYSFSAHSPSWPLMPEPARNLTILFREGGNLGYDGHFPQYGINMIGGVVDQTIGVDAQHLAFASHEGWVVPSSYDSPPRQDSPSHSQSPLLIQRIPWDRDGARNTAEGDDQYGQTECCICLNG